MAERVQPVQRLGGLAKLAPRGKRTPHDRVGDRVGVDLVLGVARYELSGCRASSVFIASTRSSRGHRLIVQSLPTPEFFVPKLDARQWSLHADAGPAFEDGGPLQTGRNAGPTARLHVDQPGEHDDPLGGGVQRVAGRQDEPVVATPRGHHSVASAVDDPLRSTR